MGISPTTQNIGTQIQAFWPEVKLDCTPTVKNLYGLTGAIIYIAIGIWTAEVEVDLAISTALDQSPS